MNGTPIDTVPDEDREPTRRLVAAYDMGHHGESASAQGSEIDEAFLDRFAIVGSAETCVKRMQELADVGLDHFMVAMQARDTDPAVAAKVTERFVREVMPAIG